MVSILFTLRGLLGGKVLPDRASFDSCFVIHHAIPDINCEITKT